MRVFAQEEDTRAGPVWAMPEPVTLTIVNPQQRVLFDPVRDANPFFHVMEFIWMMCGRRDTAWLSQFNKRIETFADNGDMHDAYGYRWRRHFFSCDQIVAVIRLLKNDPKTRRAVIAMWDPASDLAPGFNSYPCNTHIYFRVRGGCLDMTVCNRSNDLIWGMLGANAVHMTLLHELIAHFSGIALGQYTVFTNNCHVYKSVPKFDDIWKTNVVYDPYWDKREVLTPQPLFELGDTDIQYFFMDCQAFLQGEFNLINNRWLAETAYWMYKSYMARVGAKGEPGGLGMAQARKIASTDWSFACQQWISRRTL